MEQELLMILQRSQQVLILVNFTLLIVNLLLQQCNLLLSSLSLLVSELRILLLSLRFHIVLFNEVDKLLTILFKVFRVDFWKLCYCQT